MANQPDIIPMAWAANNSTADSIPETTSESGKASWDQGFPVETSLPLSQGGVPPKYGDFNGILNILSQFALFAQQGGQYAWSNALAYGVGAIVLGSDGNLYVALQASTGVNPVGDASGKWTQIVLANGTQTINGKKTFTSQIILPGTLNATVVISDNSGRIVICASTNGNANNGAKLYLNGADYSNSGNFTLQAGNSSSYKQLAGRPDGTLQWDGQPVQTSSDERLKMAIGEVPDNVLDAWGDVQWTQFKFRDAAERKGEENCRWHAGLVAQHVKSACEEKGVDALRYGILCHEEWQDEYADVEITDAEAVYDEEGREIKPAKKHTEQHLMREAGDQWMVRYEEALAMEAAYQRRRADRMVARISEMERRLIEMEAALASLIAPVGDETFAGSEEGEAQA